MLGNVLLLLVIAGVTAVSIDHHCGVCLCTFYENGCVKADCGSRNISSLPDQVPNQTCNLIMRDNGIQSVQDRDFQRLINLTNLDLSANHIDEIEDGGFAGLSNLANLELSDNHLNFTLDRVNPNVFKPLVNLQKLELHNNSYDEYPDAQLSVLVALEYLTLDGLQNRSFGTGFMILTNLVSLSLSGDAFNTCKIRSLHMSTFSNVKHITSLNISYCNISYVEPGTFFPLQNIDTLDLSYNENLQFQGVCNVSKGLQTSKLRHLIINKIVPDDAVCVVIDKSTLQYIKNTSLEVIEANDDRIEKFDVGVLEGLKNVKYISARNSRFTSSQYLKEIDDLSNLLSLDLSGSHVSYNLFHHFTDQVLEDDDYYSAVEKELCRSHVIRIENEITDGEFFPPSYRKSYKDSRFTNLDVDIRNSFKLRIPPLLKTLNFSYAQLNYQLTDIYLAENNLEYIDLSHNILTYWLGPVLGVENITYLDLSHNFAQNVTLTFFENFNSLTFLNISWNFLSNSLRSDSSGLLLRNLSKLVTLDMSNNVIIKLSDRFLEGLPSLKTLNISGNSIYSLEFNFTSNTHLQHIIASRNHIGYIPVFVRATLEELAVANNLSLDLSWNPFECTCDPKHLHFLDWLYNTKVRLQNMDQYYCVLVFNNKLISIAHLYKRYPELKDSCKGYVILTMVMLSVIVLFTTTILCGVVYRFRWRLIYLYYVGKRKLGTKTKDHDTSYDFHAFVSYADHNIDFVRTLMLVKLEIEKGVDLYIRDRDSLPGVTIAENIIDGIQRSKKSIILISKASLARKWNKYEIEMAYNEAISTKRDVMIFVMLESVPNEDIPPEIMYHIQKNPPLQYPDDDHVNADMFWASLIEAVRS